MANRTLFNSKIVFQISVLVIFLTILGVWLFGVGSHNTIFKNSILSTSILSIAFFLFITIGLFKGAKLKDNLGRITDRYDSKKIGILKNFDLGLDRIGFLEVGEGIEGLVAGIFVNIFIWIAVSIFLTFFIWTFSAFFWILILAFMAMLYWIFFRALRFVFKNSAKCKGKIYISIIYGICYTILYNFWIYGIILALHFLNN